jgi:hypothetical protein
MGSSGGGGEKPFEEQYFTFEALEAGTFTLTIPSGLSTSNLTSVSYSTDGGQTWTTTNNADSTEVIITTPTIAAGDKVLWKGSGVRLGSSPSIASKFSATGSFKIYGCIASLIKGEQFKDFIFPSSGYGYFAIDLFRGNTYLVDAENLILPSNCAVNCYSNIFRGCTNMVKAPVLPATSLKNNSYNAMFYGCSSLNYIKCLATSISATGCTSNWVNGVAATGTFVKAASIGNWTTGDNGIPSGWTVIDG